MTAPPTLRQNRSDLELFNGSREMFPIFESLDERIPAGPSRVIFTARVGKDSMWTSSVKIALRGEPR